MISGTKLLQSKQNSDNDERLFTSQHKHQSNLTAWKQVGWLADCERDRAVQVGQ